ncbi:MAG: hypothetical protein KF712_10270 [Akkermansiaceae bacterium]|nr:hypothetical protein [Akkermansiaceae bacterium]
MPPDLKQRFAVDPEAAKAQLRKEAEQNAAHDLAVGDGMQTPGQEGAKTTPSEGGKPQPSGKGVEDSDEVLIERILAEDKPDATGRTKAEKVVLMKGYVARLKQQMAKLDEELKLREERYSRGSARAADRGKYFSRDRQDFTEGGKGYTESGKASLARREEKMAGHHAKYHAARKQIYDKLKDAEKDLFDLEFGN